jgi:hypothetical protein
MAKSVGVDQQSGSGDEQSQVDQATDTESGVRDTNTAGGDDDAAVDDDEPVISTPESLATELIPKARYDELKSDPAKLEKELVKAANKKFREVATQRKALEPYTKFISALDANPKQAISALAKQLGMKIEGGTEEATSEKMEAALMTSVKKALGPEYEDLADRLIPAISAVTDSMVKEALKPILNRQDEIVSDAAARSSQAAMDVFAKKYPDWDKHEEAMVELSRRLPPGEGMSEVEYLESIYFLVTRDKSEGDAVKRTVDRMKKAAGNSGDRSSTVSKDKVSSRPVKPPTFKEAAEAALRGETLE